MEVLPGTRGAIDQITDDALARALAAYELPVEGALATYHASHPSASAGDLLAAIQGDWYFRIPPLRLADAHAQSTAATCMYEFAWRSPAFDGRLGACHGLEVAFDTLGYETEPLTGTDPPQQLAEVRPQPEGHHAFRHNLKGSGRSSIRRTGAVGRRALVSVGARLDALVL